MKTTEVTLPPLFSGWDGNPLADGRPSHESGAQASPELWRYWLAWESCRFG